jgi:isopenicillin-N N-acyltransferase-like protein
MRRFQRGFVSAALLAATCLVSAQQAPPPAPQPPASPRVNPHELTVIAGKPRERGQAYGQRFKKEIHAFLNQEIYQAFNNKPATRADMLHFAGLCAKEIAAYSPVIHAELEGMAQGSELALDEIVLITLHEELYHRGQLPKVDHCTAVAVGPPDTKDGNTYVGQTWDWMPSVFGQSTMLRWQRDEGPSVLAYAYPGLWVGAGMNSAGLALTWTSADLGNKKMTVRAGIPSYVLLAHLLYQDSLEAAVKEAQRAKNAGWFTFVLGDAKGNLVNIEGSPEGVIVEKHQGRLARVLFGSRAMTKTPPGQKVKVHERCEKMYDLIGAAAGTIDRSTMQHFFADPKCAISVGKSTLDMMVFNCTTREAWVSRGPAYGATWTRFDFSKP